MPWLTEEAEQSQGAGSLQVPLSRNVPWPSFGKQRLAKIGAGLISIFADE